MSSAVRPLAVVLNRRAAAGRAAERWPELSRELDRLRVPYRLLEADSPATALAEVRALPPGWAVAAAGGEGTVAAVLPAIIEQRRPLLPIPLGTGNDLAGSLGLRSGDCRGALAHVHAPLRWADALRVSYGEGPHDPLRPAERYSLNGAGMGFDAQLTANLPQAPAWTKGALRYLWAAVTTARQLQPVTCLAALDGQPVYRGPAMLCALMNARTLGGGFLFSPRGDIYDGRLDMVLAGDVRRRHLPDLMARVRVGRHLSHPAVTYCAARVAEVTWERPTPLHIDGELLGECTWLRAEVLRGVVPLLN